MCIEIYPRAVRNVTAATTNASFRYGLVESVGSENVISEMATAENKNQNIEITISIKVTPLLFKNSRPSPIRR